MMSANPSVSGSVIGPRIQKKSRRPAGFRKRRRQRVLQVEALESRLLLSADTSSPWNRGLGLGASAFYMADGERIELTLHEQEYAVKFKRPDASQWLAQLDVLGQLPDGLGLERVTGDVYLFKGDGAELDSLRDYGVVWSTPAYVSQDSQTTVLVLDEAVVALQPGIVPESFFGDQVVSYRPLLGTSDQFVVTLHDAGQAALDYANQVMLDERVAWATPNLYQNMRRMFLPNDPLFPNQWHLHNTGSNSGQTGALAGADVNAFAAWDIATGAGVTIAVLDDGIERAHPDLAANIFVNPGELPGNGIDDDGNGWIDDISGWSFANNSPNPNLSSDDEHGTAVAGIAAAVGNNSLGVTGAAFNAQILPVQMFDGGAYVGDAATAQAVYYAAGRTADGLGTWDAAQVINCSWGGGSPSTALTTAFTWASNEARDGKGVAIFISSGNGYSSTVSYPARLSGTLPGVMAVGASNDIDVRAGYSNYGAELDFVAPSSDFNRTPGGQNSSLATTTTDRTGTIGYNPASSPSGDYTTNQYVTGFGGTSSASPLAAGVGALLLSVDPNLTAAEVKQLLRDTAAKVGGVTYDSNGFHVQYGYGRINAYAALLELGMHAVGTVPAEGQIVTTTPALDGGYQVDFSYSYDPNPASIVASGFKVNGVPAASYTIIDADTLQFNFSAQPVTAQGLQTLTLDAGTVMRLSDGEPLHRYDGSFRYDLLRLDVTGTDPPLGSIITLPFTTLDLHFNEPVDSGSVQVSDFVVNQGRVVDAVLVANDRVRLTLDDVLAEGTLTLHIPANAVTDEYGNPNVAFSGSYNLDFDTVVFPAELTAVAPRGSLIYRGSVEGGIGYAGDADSFTLELDAGQTLTVVVETEPGLQAAAELSGPGGLLIQSAAGAAGETVILQTQPVSDPGVYTISVSGVSDSTGGYQVRGVLNAAVELEEYGGLGNDELASAQPLDGAFIDLGGAAQRAAVVGGFGSTVRTLYWTDMDENPGWTLEDQWEWGVPTGAGTGDPTSGFTGDNVIGYHLNGNYANNLPVRYATTPAFDASGFDTVVLSFYRWLSIESATYDKANIQATSDGVNWTTVWEHTGGTIQDGQWKLQTYDISDVAAGQSNVQIRWGMGPTDSSVTYGGWNLDDVLVTRSALVPDYYRFDLSAGDSATLALSALDGGAVTVELVDATDTVLALGARGRNVHQVIDNFVAAAAGTYYAKITGSGEYSLVVTRNAALDLEPNDTIEGAQAILSAQVDGEQRVLGHVGSRQESLFGINWQDGSILELDPATGSLIRTLPAPPTFIATNPFGLNLAATDTLLKYNAGADFGDTTIARLDIDDGGLVSSFAGPGWGYTALAIVGDEIFANDDNFDVIRVFRAATGAHVRDLPNGRFAGMAGDSSTGRLFGVSQWDDALFELDPLTGAILRQVPQAGQLGNQQGMGFVAGELFVSETTSPGALNVINVYDADTFAHVRTLDVSAAVPGSMIAGLGGDGLPQGAAVDYYQVLVGATGALLLETALPAAGPGEFQNGLYPALSLYDAEGALVGTADGNVDGRNSRLEFPAGGLTAGTYYVAVTPSSATPDTSGEYVLRVVDNHVVLPNFYVVATSPSDGLVWQVAPDRLTVEFNDAVLLTSLQASDLLVNGNPAPSILEIPDARTVVFELPVLAEGTHVLEFPAGSMQDVQGTPLEAFSMSLVVDQTGPRILSTLWNGQPLPDDAIFSTGSLEFQATFDEALRPPGVQDVILFEAFHDIILYPNAVSFEGNVFTASFTDPLPEGSYTLVLVSGENAFADVVGNPLDGEPVGANPDGTPTGNGSPGGDYYVDFLIDRTSPVSTNPFVRLRPLGSLVSVSAVNPGLINFAGDEDDFEFYLEAGQTVAAIAVPDDPDSVMTLEIPGLASLVTAPGPGQPVVLPPVLIGSDGVVTIRTVGDTPGTFHLAVYRNASLEALVGDSGAGNQLAIHDSYLQLGSGRYAVVGSIELGLPEESYHLQEDFNGGIPATWTRTDIGPAPWGTSDQFGDWGNLTGGTGLAAFADADFTNEQKDPYDSRLISPVIDLSGQTRALLGYKAFFEEFSGNEALDVDVSDDGGNTWTTVARYNSGAASYDELFDISFAAGRAEVLVRFRYYNLLGDWDWYAQVDDVLVLTQVYTPVVDEYTIDLTGKAGQWIDVILAGQGQADFSGELLELLDSDGNAVLATGVADPLGAAATNYDLAILDFQVPADGVYTIRFTSVQTEGDYTILVTDQLLFDSEPNDASDDPLRSVEAGRPALGFLGSDSSRHPSSTHSKSSPDGDFYALDLAVGQTLTIWTATPFDNPAGSPWNDLDPELILYGPDGSQIAADQNSRDGKNAEVTFTALTTGVYRVLVAAESGSGEYLLGWDFQIGGTRIDMTVVREPSKMDDQGEIADLPASESWVHEWELFWVEIWVSTPDTATVGVAAAMVDLHYNTDYLTAIEIQYGPAFTKNLTGTIDDALGRVVAIGGQTERSDVGDDAYVLLARVRFGSIGDDQVPIVPEDCFLGPYDMEMSLADGQAQLVGSEPVVPELGASPDTELWAVMYDFGSVVSSIEENNQIDFGDFSFFAAAFGKLVGPPQPPYTCWADFDHSGRVDFGDLAFFAPNFGKTRADVQSRVQTLVFPSNFPVAWRAGAGGGSGEAVEGEASGGEGQGQAAPAFVDIPPDAGPGGFTRLASLSVADRARAAIDSAFTQIGADSTERWTALRPESAGRRLGDIERNQRPMRLGNRCDSLDDTLSLLADPMPNAPSDDVLDPLDTLFTQLGG